MHNLLTMLFIPWTRRSMFVSQDKIEPYSLFIEVLLYSKDIHSLMALWLGCCEAWRCYFWRIVYQLKANSTGLLSNVPHADWSWLPMNFRRKSKDIAAHSFPACCSHLPGKKGMLLDETSKLRFFFLFYK